MGLLLLMTLLTFVAIAKSHSNSSIIGSLLSNIILIATASESPLDLDAIRRLYGSGLAMRLATERQMALKVGGRLPGLDAHPDSRAMYETLTGDDVSIGFGDYLNLRRNRPEGGDFGGAFDVPHTSMEHKLGL